MFSILKKKTIEVFCYTNKKAVFDYFKIIKSNNLYPNWWKSLPKNSCPITSYPTMKGCFGFLEYYKQSFTMPLWSDFIFYTNNYGNVDIEASVGDQKVVKHDEKQFLGLLNNNDFDILKVISPWIFDCKQNINFYTSGAFFDNFALSQNVQVVPGIANWFFNKGNNVFFIVKKNENPILVKHSTPLRHIFPLTERPVVFICEYDEKKFDEVNSENYRFSFVNSIYQKIKLHKNKVT